MTHHTAVLRRHRRTAAVLLSVLALSAGCSRRDSAVEVSVPSPTEHEQRWCARLKERLPKSIGKDLDRRRTDPASPLVSAWGDPAVVLRCGVADDSGYPAGAQLLYANSRTVGWWQSERGDRVVWSTPRATVRVELLVPSSYESHGGMLALISPVIETNGVF